MRRDVAFRTEDGVTLRDWHVLPDGTGPWPTVVMTHGFSAVKEMDLDRFADAFAARGVAAVVFDNRNVGASGGEPRQEIDPWMQARDYRDKISFAETLPETAAGRIGVWGSSYSGAHVIVIAAIDRRVKAVVSQVPLISGHRDVRRLVRADLVAAVNGMFEPDRRARYGGAASQMIKVVADDGSPCALPTPDSFAWFTETGRTRAPSWRNQVTLRSVELFTADEPGAWIAMVSPTPLLMVVAAGDHLTVADEALAAYERALQPKAFVRLQDAYVTGFEQASARAAAWFQQHLTAR